MLEGRALLSTVSFANGYGASGTNVSVDSVVLDSSGNEYVTGSFTGTVNFGGTNLTSAGGYDVFIAKLNSSGAVAWVDQMGSTGNDFGRGIALNSSNGNLYVTGFYSGTISFGTTTLSNAGGLDAFVAELSNSGSVVWAKGFGGTGNDYGQGIAVDSSGDVYTTGSFQGTVNFGGNSRTAAGDAAIYLLKQDSSGNVLWVRQMGGPDTNDPSAQSGFSVALDPSGSNAYVSGVFRGTAAFGSTVFTSNGGTDDAFVVKISSAGAYLWAKDFGGPGTDEGTGIVVDGSGNIYETGEFAATATFGSQSLTSTGGFSDYVVRLDASGNVIWARGFGGNQDTLGYGIAVDSSGNIYNTGQFRGYATFGSITLSTPGDFDVFVTKLDPNGNVLASESFGSTGDDLGYQVAVSGSLVTVVGTDNGTVAFDGIARSSTATGFVIQLNNLSHPENNPLDYTGNGKAELTLVYPAYDIWLTRNSSNNALLVQQFGDPSQTLVPISGDFTGVGKASVAMFYPQYDFWLYRDPTTGAVVVQQFGDPSQTNLVPVPADYDGDGKTDLALFNPTYDLWIIRDSSTGNLDVVQFGDTTKSGAIPVPADYDGDGKADLALFYPSTDSWVVRDSSTGVVTSTQFGVGIPNAVPVPGDYDGDGKADLAVLNPSNDYWVILQSTTHTASISQFGNPSQNLVPPLSAYNPQGSTSTAPAVPALAAVSTSSTGALVTSNTSASKPATTSSSVLVSTPVRSALVIGQAGETSTTGPDPWSSALDKLYG